MAHPGIYIGRGKGRYITGTAGETVRKARKEYVCGDGRAYEGCGRPILKGTYYIAEANPRGMYGELTRHFHEDCEVQGR